jgi:alkane 1-monooxygenase
MPEKRSLGSARDGARVRSSGYDSASPLVFFMIYWVASVALCIALRGGWYTVLAPLGVTFFAVPLLDALIGVDTRNPPEREPGVLATAVFRLATWLAVPTQAAILLWGASVSARGAAPGVEFAGLVLCAGMSGGVIGINVAHELIHRSSRLDRALGGVLLVMVFYRHWAIEHVAGHHRRVATPEDPASARLGESLPAFWIRSVVKGFSSAWQIERARAVRRGIRSPLGNRVVVGLLESCGLAGGLVAVFGLRALWFFLAQSAVAIAFLETINYVEHYGLERRSIRPGVYERVTPLHSWNASHWLTNTLLFNLQRHSDHHAWPARPYYRLRYHAGSPQLPYGYAAMMVIALIPPLWRRVMDPRVREHRSLTETPLAR